MKDKKVKKNKKAQESMEKAIIKNIPLDGIKWLSQPLSITMMRADLSPLQVNLIVEMVDKFQEKILEQIRQTEEERKQSPVLFSDDDMRDNNPYKIKFPLSDLDVRPDAYDELSDAARKLQGMQITMPVSKGNGMTNLAFFSLFSRIEIPFIEKEYNYKGKKRRAGFIEMTMDREAFNDVMRVGRQHTKYLKSVTRNRSCGYTSRMYMFISTYKIFGKWTVPYLDFHQMLGFSYEEKGQVVFLKYDLFSDVKRRVLDPAMNELRKMSEEGRSDCYYEYEPIFPPGKKRGLPDKLCFTIHSSNFGKEVTAQNKRLSETILIEKFLKNELQQTPTNCKKLLNLLTDENISGFQKKMKELKAYCQAPEHKIDNLRSYAWQSLIDYLEAHQTSVEEITSAHLNNNNIESVGKMSGEQNVEDIQTEIQEVDLDKWNLFLNEIRSRVGEQAYNIWFIHIVPLSFENNVLVIKVPSKFFYEYIEEQYVEKIKEALFASFGENVKLMYNVKE